MGIGACRAVAGGGPGRFFAYQRRNRPDVVGASNSGGNPGCAFLGLWQLLSGSSDCILTAQWSLLIADDNSPLLYRLSVLNSSARFNGGLDLGFPPLRDLHFFNQSL